MGCGGKVRRKRNDALIDLDGDESGRGEGIIIVGRQGGWWVGRGAGGVVAV